MSSSENSSSDFEAALEAELARLAEGEPNSPSDLLRVDYEELLQEDDDSDAEEDEPASLRQLREAYARRGHALDEFQGDMEQAYREITAFATGVLWSNPPEAQTHPTQATALGLLIYSSPVDAGIAAAVHVRPVPEDGRPGDGGDKVCQQQGIKDAGDATGPGTSSELAAGVSVPTSDVGAEPSKSARERQHTETDERVRAAREQQQGETAATVAGEAVARQHDKEDDEEKEATVAAAEQACLPFEGQHAALLALEAERAAAAAEREEQAAAEAAHQARLAAEREATAQRLEAVERAALERAAAREVAMEALRREAVELARRHLAARRIARAWRKYRAGPAWAARQAAAVCIQAAWRGHRGRREAAAARRLRDAMCTLEAAAKAGQSEELHAAVEAAQALGLGDAVQRRMTELQRATDEAGARLRAAAIGGSYADFQAALEAARGLPKLAKQIEESTAAFQRRRAESEANLRSAVADQPMSQFTRLLEHVGGLGLDPQVVKTCLEEVRRRDAEVAAQLAAAAAAATAAVTGRAGGGGVAAWDAVALEALMQRGMRLGLKGDVAALRYTLDRRRRTLAAELQRAGLSGAAAEVGALVAEARRLGLGAEADAAEQQLLRRRSDLECAIHHAAEHGSASRLIALAERAPRLGVSADTLHAAGGSLQACQAARSQALSAAAVSSGLRTLLCARGSAVQCGLALPPVLSADQALDARRRATISGLQDLLQRLCISSLSNTASSGSRDVVRCPAQVPVSILPISFPTELLAGALGLGDPRALLRCAAAATISGWGSDSLGNRAAMAPASQTPSKDCGRISQQQQHRGREWRQQAGSGVCPASSCGALRLDLLPPGLRAVLASDPHQNRAKTAVPGSGTGGCGYGGGCSACAGAGDRCGCPQATVVAATVEEASSAMWSLGSTARQLALLDAVCLALCVLNLRADVASARGLTDLLRDVLVLRDIWGRPLLPGSPSSQPPQQHQADALADRVVKRVVLRRGRCHSAPHPLPWPSPTELLLSSPVLRSLWSAAPADLCPSASASAAGHPTSACNQHGQTPPPPPPRHPTTNPHRHSGASVSAAQRQSQPLTRQVLLRNASAAASSSSSAAAAASSSSSSVAAAVDISTLTRLDLGLERLGSLAGLDVMCGALQVLHADSNELTTLEGLTGLTRLCELSLKHNHLTSCCLALASAEAGAAVGARGRHGNGASRGAGRALEKQDENMGVEVLSCSGLPAGRVLQRLALDSNHLGGGLEGLRACRGLRSLSCADNALTHLGPDLGAACASTLTRLDLHSNCLTTLLDVNTAVGGGGQQMALTLGHPGAHAARLGLGVASLTALRELDVSGNRLTDLDGVQALRLLQSLSARGNALTHLPQPLVLPYLSRLDLSHNALTAFGGGGDRSTTPTTLATTNCGASRGPDVNDARTPTDGTATVTGAGSTAAAVVLAVPRQQQQSPALVLPSLATLLLNDNQISRLGPLGPLVGPRLTSLDLSFNLLPSRDSLQPLASLTALRTLNIGDNPATQPPPAVATAAGAFRLVGRRMGPSRGMWSEEAEPYRDRILRLVPSLRELNHEEVGRAEGLSGTVAAAAASPVVTGAVMRCLRAGTGRGLLMAATTPSPAPHVCHAVPRAVALDTTGAKSPSSPAKMAAMAGAAVAVASHRRAAARAARDGRGGSGCANPRRGCTPAFAAASTVMYLVPQHCRMAPTAADAFSSYRPLPPRIPLPERPLQSSPSSSSYRSSPAADIDLLWDASAPFDLTESQYRTTRYVQQQLSLRRDAGTSSSSMNSSANSQDGETHGSLALSSVLPLSPAVSVSTARGPAPSSASSTWSSPHSGICAVEALLLDTPTLRRLRPAWRALRSLGAGSIRGLTRSDRCSKPAAAAASSSGRPPPRGTPAWEALATEAEARREQREAEAWRAGAEEVRLLSGVAADRALQQGRQQGLIMGTTTAAPAAAAGAESSLLPQMAAQPSFFLQRMRTDAAVAATAMQAAWRGLRARRCVAMLRDEGYQARCCAAATVIQSWWRGHRVRAGERLRSLKVEAAARRDEAARRQQGVRQVAATKIQAFFRGHLVRRRLHAAMAAARGHPPQQRRVGGLSGGGGLAAGPHGAAAAAGNNNNHHQDDDLLEDLDLGGGSGELDELLGFLQPLEKWFQEEEVMGPPQGTQQQQQLPPTGAAISHRPQLDHSVAPWPPPPAAGDTTIPCAGGVAAAAAPPTNLHKSPWSSPVGANNSSHLPPLQPLPPPPQPLPRPQQQQHPHNQLAPLDLAGTSTLADALIWRSTAGGGPSATASPPGPQQAWGPAPGGPSAPPPPPPQLLVPCLSGEEGGLGTYDGRPEGEVATPGNAAPSPSGSVNQARREQRHLERLQALMAEWGFKDLATAEAYCRRTLRQKQGESRRKLQDKYRDPAQRLHKLQQVVGARQASDGSGSGAHRSSPPGGPGTPPPQRLGPQPEYTGKHGGSSAPSMVAPGSAPNPSRYGVAAPGGSDSASAGSSQARPLRNLNSADGVLEGGGVVSVGSQHAGGDGGAGRGLLPPLLKRSNSHGNASPGPERPVACVSGGGGWSGAGGDPLVPPRAPMSIGSAPTPTRQHKQQEQGFPSPGSAGGLSPADWPTASTPQSPLLLPPLANNWVHSPAHTPQRTGGSGASSGPPGSGPGLGGGWGAVSGCVMHAKSVAPALVPRGKRGERGVGVGLLPSGGTAGDGGAGGAARQGAVQSWRASS